MFLQRFDPASIDPLLLFNRQSDFDWLVDAISDYLSDPDPRARRALSFCIFGEKGVGKTILTRAALWRTRQKFSDRAIFVEADCRQFHSTRDVINVIAAGVVKQLDEFRRHEPKSVSNELLATAQVLAAITRFENAQLKVIHQHLAQFKVATSLKGEQSLLSAIKLDFQISLELTTSTSQQLSGEVRFDEINLCKALIALFEDIRRNDIDVVLYIDNMDEISHQYRTDAERKKAEHETQTLLLLRNAPIVFVVNMRTYYSGILPREMTNRRILNRLSAKDLQRILDKRLEPTREEIKKAVQSAESQKVLTHLAGVAFTPLAYLTWFKSLFEAGMLSMEQLDEGITQYLEVYYGTLPANIWRDVARAFPDPKQPVNRETLLAACGGNEVTLRQVIERQGVLPKNFWDPQTYYTLDPELALIRAVDIAAQTS